MTAGATGTPAFAPDRPSATIAALDRSLCAALPTGLSAGWAVVRANRAPAHVAEQLAGAVPRRAWEFAAGRAAARVAMDGLGCAAGPLRRLVTGAPLWPEDVTGSISHSGGIALCVAARNKDAAWLGVDLIAPCDRPEPPLAELFLRDDEFEDGDIGDSATLAAKLGAKEAGIKAYAQGLGRPVGFLDIRIGWDPGAGFVVDPVGLAMDAPVPRLNGALARVGDYLIALAHCA